MSLRDPYPVGFRIRKGATGVLEIRERVGGEGAADGAQRGDDGGRGGGEGARGGDGSGGGEEEARGARGGAAGSAPQGGEEGTFKLPHTLKQKYVEVTAKTRLPALLGLFRSRTSEGGKVVVFVSSCDGVEFLHLLATRAWDAAVAPREGGSGEDEDDFGEQRSRVRGAGPPAKKGGAGGKRGRLADAAEIGPCLHAPIVKLHGNMPQSQRTASFLAFVRAQSGVLICTDVAARGLDFPEVTSIVQYDPPGEPQEYVHR